MQYSFKIAILTLALGAATAAFAQTPTPQPGQSAAPVQQGSAPTRQPNPAKEAKHLSRQLGLTPDQTSQVQGIFADREQRVQTLMASNPDPKTMRQQRRAIMQDEQTKLSAILTPAQQQQWATLKSEHKQRGNPAAAQSGAQTTLPPSL